MYTVGLDKIILIFIFLFFYLFFVLYHFSIYSYSFSWYNTTFYTFNNILVIPKIYNEDEIKEVLFGSLLGDGHLEKQIKMTNARFCFTQSISHYEYFISVWNIITQISPCTFLKSSYTDKRTNKIYESYSFKTKTHPLYTEFFSYFYKVSEKNKKKKILPLDLTLLTPLALAHWIMQDGTKSTTGGFYLCTDNFNKEECIRVSNYLNKKYLLSTSLHKKSKNSWRVYIKAKSFNDLKNLVIRHMDKSMLYKINIKNV